LNIRELLMHKSCWGWDDGDLLLRVKVQPKGRREQIGEQQAGRLKIKVRAPATDGKANADLVDLVARAFKVPRRRVSIVAGFGSRQKSLRIAAPVSIPAFLLGDSDATTK
jgi:hypothetical protein